MIDRQIYKKIPAFLKWTAVLGVILLVIFIATINIFSAAFLGKEYALKEYFKSIRVPVSIDTMKWDDCDIRYIKTGLDSDTADLILFIHGAPGNLENFKEYLGDFDLVRQFRMISMDRPGYGGSCPGYVITDISKQAQAAARLLQSLPANRRFIVSHSYGTAVAGKVAADYPELVDGLVMCAPLNDPDAEPMHWYSKVANWKLTRMLMPEFVDMATDEKISHSSELKKIRDDWKRIDIPVLHIHGEDDGLAPFTENVRFSRENIPDSLLRIYSEPEMGHLNIWINAGTIKSEMLDFLSNIP